MIHIFQRVIDAVQIPINAVLERIPDGILLGGVSIATAFGLFEVAEDWPWTAETTLFGLGALLIYSGVVVCMVGLLMIPFRVALE